MGITFNADEVLGIAERIETNAGAFYRHAHELKRDRPGADLLLKLAEMEDRHKAVFAEMRAGLGDREKEATAADPYLEANAYLQEYTNSHDFEGSPASAESLTGSETLEQILNTAIRLEEKAIVFFVGLKDMVPRRLGPEKVETIIGEEKRHLAELAEELKRLRDLVTKVDE